MKIVLILTSIEIGTIEKVSYNLYQSLLSQKGVELFVVNLKSSDKDYYKFHNLYNIEECKSVNLIVRQIYNLKKVYKLYTIKSKIKPDISITTQEAGTTINILSFGNEKKIGIFHAPYYQARSQGKLSFYLQYLSYKYLYFKLNKIFCVSSEIKNSILESFSSIDKTKLEVVYNIHDFNEIKEKSNELLDSNEEFLFEDKVIIYVGRFDKNKAPDRLIKSFYQLRINKKIGNDIKLIFIGDGDIDYKIFLENLITKFDLKDYVSFLGFRSNPYKYIKRSTVLVSCSFSEGLPGVVIESIFLNIPVVVTNSSLGLWEILDCSDNYKKNLSNIHVARKGIITSNIMEAENKNILALSNAIEMIIVNENDYQEIKKNDFKFLDFLDEKNIVQNFIKLYN